MAELWEKSFWYSFFRPYIDFCTRLSYTSLTVEGKFPDDGRALIIAPNHTNTLLDALVVMQHRRDTMAFGARADIFSKPAAARFLNYIKVVPIARKRDGIRAVAQNLEIMPVILDILHHGVPFCIFPEGRHRPMHSLLPIHKGVGRIALRNAADQPTCIVPVGIDYGDFFHYRSWCHIRIGEPIDMGEWMREHEGEHEAKSSAEIGELLSERLKSLILYIPDDENYERRLAQVRPPRRRRWWEIPLAVLTSPFFILSAILSLPLWGTAEYICHRRLKDTAFRNSIRYLVRLAGTPIVFLLWAVVGFILLPHPVAFALLLYYCFSYSIFYDWLNLVRIDY